MAGWRAVLKSAGGGLDVARRAWGGAAGIKLACGGWGIPGAQRPGTRGNRLLWRVACGCDGWGGAVLAYHLH